MVDRRSFLRVAGAGALATLAACTNEATTSSTGRSVTPSARTSTNPFGAPDGSSVEMWVDEGQLPRRWADDLARAVAQGPESLQVQVNATSQIGATLASRMTSNPPDLVQDAGADLMGLGTLATALATLDEVVAQPAGTGGTIREALRPGMTTAGTVANRLVAVPSALVVRGLWYSGQLFTQQGWSAPTTFDELHALGVKAKAQQRQLFCWGRDTATWLQRMALSSAVKQGGRDVLQALQELEPGAWSNESVQQALVAVHRLVADGMVRSGGSQTAWKNQVSRWSGQQVLFVPSGPGIVTQAAVASDFNVRVVPDPSLGSSPALGADALCAGPGLPMVIPAKASNPAGAREVLRTFLQQKQALAFSSRTHLVSSLTKAVPAAPSSPLQQQLSLLAAAGDATYDLRFLDHYGTNHDHQALWNAFLEGAMDVATLTRESQRISDLVRADPQQLRMS